MRTSRLPAWAPYVIPFGLFLVLTSIEGQFAGHYPLIYTTKIALVAAAVLFYCRSLPELKFHARGLGLAVVLGILLAVIWVGVDPYTPRLAFLGHRTAYNPFAEIPNSAVRLLFLIVRFFGLVVLVPIIEELFYRGFLLRFVTDVDNFERVPLGTFSAVALAVNILLMASSHPEWFVAAIFAAAMCWMIHYTKNLWACIIAHGVTNLLLGVYVLTYHQWQYW